MLVDVVAGLGVHPLDVGLELVGLDPTDTIVGLVYLGWPVSEPDCPPRPEPDLAWVDVDAPEVS